MALERGLVARAGAAMSATPREVLVVDDHQPDRRLLSLLLADRGFAVREAADCRAALAEARRRRPDLIIADVLLPVVGGYELALRLRTDEQLAAVPLVLHSAHFRPSEVRAVTASLGVSAVLPKPFEIADLDEALSMATSAAARPAEPSFDAPLVALLTQRLMDEIAAVEQLCAERRELIAALVGAQEEERRRLARELHDGAVQQLVALSLSLQLLERKMSREAGRRCNAVRREVDAIGVRLREMLVALRPPGMEAGLASALGEAAGRAAVHGGFAWSVEADGDVTLGADRDLVVFRIAQEALANAARHSHARRVSLRLVADAEGVLLEVDDDGVGFGPQAPGPGHIGLSAMRERAEIAGGRFAVDGRRGGGTLVRAWLPR